MDDRQEQIARLALENWREHLKTLGALDKRIERLLDDAVRRALARGRKLTAADIGRVMKSHPELRAALEGAMEQLRAELTAAIEQGSKEAWLRANAGNDAVISAMAAGNDQLASLLASGQNKPQNDRALRAFQQREMQGMRLSDRVWRSTEGMRLDMERAIEVALAEGVPAQKLSQRVRQLLREPHRLYRRVRDKDGNLRLSQAAQAYHPGAGVYRSSYKNAMRVARTEVNMAYQASDSERWARSWWVKGIRISLSNNHTCLDGRGKPAPLVDICDELAGDYPADFKFTGWHPQCRCYAVAITLSDAEMDDYQRRRRAGEDMSLYAAPGAVAEPPRQFKEWLAANAGRLSAAAERGSTPYFIANNPKYADANYKPAQADAPAKQTSQERSAERHARRTPEEAERIQKAWNRRRLWNANDGIEQLDLFHDKTYQELIRLLEEDIALGAHKAFEHDLAKMKLLINAARDVEYMNTERLMNTPLFKANNTELESAFGARGTAMPFRPANQLRGNPHYAESSAYRVNCQTCVVANELRRRGFNLEALANTKGSALEALSYHTESAWIDATGKIPASNIAGLRKVMRKRWDGTEYPAWEKTCKNRKQMVAALESEITEDGRYHIKWAWAKGNSGHIITVERIDGKFRYYDPQNGQVITDFVGYIDGIKTAGGIKWLRVDTLRVNPDIAKKILTTPASAARAGKAATGRVTGRITPEIIQLRKDVLNSVELPISQTHQHYDNLITRSLYLGKKPLSRILNHCISAEEIDATKYIWQHPDKLQNPRISPLGEGKDLTSEKAQMNIRKKRKRGVEEYIEYEFEYNGQSWLIKTERHRAGFEQFYHIRKK